MVAEPIGLLGDDYLDRPLRSFFNSVAGSDSVPAAGSVVAALGTLAAGLAAKVAHRSITQLPDANQVVARADELRKKFEPLITADAVGYAAALTVRGDERTAALHSLSVELAVMAEAAADVAELASMLAAHGNQNLRFDADAAVRIAVTVTEIAAELIGANVGETQLSARARAAVERAQVAAHGPATASGNIEE